jgi:hypothetical protein
MVRDMYKLSDLTTHHVTRDATPYPTNVLGAQTVCPALLRPTHPQPFIKGKCNETVQELKLQISSRSGEE